MKKIVSTVLILFILFTSFSSAHANPNGERYLAVSSSRLKELEDLLDKTGPGLYNSIDMLGFLAEYGMTVHYITVHLEDMLSSADKNYYYSLYRDFVTDYNDKFGDYFVFDIPSNTQTGFKEKGIPIVSKDIGVKTSNKLRELHSEYIRLDTPAKKEAYINRNAILIARIKQLYNKYYEILEYLQGMHYKGDSYDFDFNVNALTGFEELTQAADKVYKDINLVGDIFIDTTKTVRENLLVGEGTLSLNYLALLSGSAIYLPFRSYTGGGDFFTAVQSIAPEEQREPLLNMYSSVKNKVKPLYRRDLDDNGNPVGTATLITIDTFLEDIKKGNSTALVTVTGEFHYNTEINNWVYSIGEEATYAYDSVTDESKLSKPVLMFSNKYLRIIDNTTYVLLNNILGSTSNLNKIKDSRSRYLFINPFGDIVTDDNLVIVPGASNPIIWETNHNYNPYTVAFMNSYPVIAMGIDEFTTSSKSDIGQYIGLADDDDEFNKLVNYYKINSKNTVDINTPLLGNAFEQKFYINGVEASSMISPNTIPLNTSIPWDDNHPLWGNRIFITRQNVLIESTSIFPYNPIEDTSHSIASIIAQNFYKTLTTDDISESTVNVGKLNDFYLNAYWVENQLDGTNNPIGYTKDKKIDYDVFNNDGFTRFKKMLHQFSSDFLETFGDADNVIGIGSFYANDIYGVVFNFIEQELELFLMVLGAFILFGLMKNFRGYLNTAVVLLGSIGVLWVSVKIIPGYLPLGYNLMLSNFGESLAYESIMLNVEDYNSEINHNITQVDDSGNFVFNTNAITLHREPILNKHNFYKDLAILPEDANNGNIHIINQRSGMFVEVDSIKINTDILLGTLSIKSEPFDLGNGITYQFSSTKTVSNSVDMYTPYYSVVDSFIEKINKNIELFKVPRKLMTYSNGTSKEIFGVYSYINSPQFLSPGNYKFTYIADNLINDGNEETLRYYQELEKNLREYYGDNFDFLGLETILIKDIEKYYNTNWYKVMKKEGFYSLNDEPNYDKLSKTIDYVNYYARKFIFDNIDVIGSVSDETLIEVISLKAVILLSNNVSSMQNYMYPYTMSYNDLKLEDLLKVILIDDFNKYRSINYNLVEYLDTTVGSFNLIIFCLVVFLFYVLSFTISILIPLTYLTLPVMIIIKIIGNKNLGETYFGYFKIVMALAFISTLFAIVTSFIGKIDDKIVVLYLLLLEGLVVIRMLVYVLKCLLRDPLNFGNIKVDVKNKDLLSKLLPSKIPFLLNKIGQNRRQIGMHRSHMPNSYSRYDYRRNRYDYSSMYDNNYYGNEYPNDHDYNYTEPNVEASSSSISQVQEVEYEDIDSL